MLESLLHKELIKMTSGELIHQKRKQLKMTLDDVGKACGVPRSTVSRWENGVIRNIKRETLAKLCNVLQIDPVVFYSRDEIINREEMLLLSAWREADEKVKEIVLGILTQNKKTNDTTLKIG